MRKFPVAILAVSMLFSLAVSIGAALAASYTTSQVTVFVERETHTVNTGQVNNSGTSASDSVQNATTNSTGYSDGSVSADFGALGANLSAVSNGTIFSDTKGRASFIDWITVTSDTLPTGATVSVLLSQTIDGNFMLNGYRPTGSMSSFFGAGINRWIQTTETVSWTGDITTNNSTSNDGSSGIPIFQYYVGNRIQLSGDLQVHVTTARDASIEAQFGNTIHYFLDPQTPGVTLQSDSGHSYSSAAAPEPISSILFLTGGATLAAKRYFGKRKK